MERLKAYLQFVQTKPVLDSIISFAIDPEIGNTKLVAKFNTDMFSHDPHTVQSAIERIGGPDIPLHIAANGFRTFVERDEFHTRQVYEQTIFDLPHDKAADSHIYASKFAETTEPFASSHNKLALTRRGLDQLHTKSRQPQYKFLRSYEKGALESCFIASTKLIANAIENIADPIPESFLHDCSLGITIASYFDLFGTDARDIYKKGKRGIDLLHMHGSSEDRQAIEQVLKKLEG